MDKITISKEKYDEAIRMAKKGAKRSGYNQFVYVDMNDGEISFSHNAQCVEIGNNVLLAVVEAYWDWGILKTKVIDIKYKFNFV